MRPMRIDPPWHAASRENPGPTTCSASLLHASRIPEGAP